MRKGDYVVIVLLLFLSGLIFVWTKYSFTTDGKERILEISVDGKVIHQIDLSKVEKKEIHIDNQFAHNVVRIDKGKVTMVESSCKDKICMKMGTITQPGESIICLPNHLILTIVSTNEDDLDIIIK